MVVFHAICSYFLDNERLVLQGFSCYNFHDIKSLIILKVSLYEEKFIMIDTSQINEVNTAIYMALNIASNLRGIYQVSKREICS